MNAPLVFDVPAQAPRVLCRACGHPIVFVLTSKNKRMPVDAEGEKRGQSHFATCTDPKRFRKRDRVKGPG